MDLHEESWTQEEVWKVFLYSVFIARDTLLYNLWLKRIFEINFKKKIGI